MGEEAIQYCRSYAMEAERKMGEMLAQTERAQGKRTDLVTLSDQVNNPTLSDLGLTKRESAEAQMLAQTERANIARDKKKAELNDGTPPPTLSDLSLTKRECRHGQIC